MELLEQSKKTITDLRDILLASLGKIDDLVLDIASNANGSARLAAQAILNRTNQIADWTHTRMEAWSLHYQNVTSFLQDVVRVDPKREIAMKLKSAIQTLPNDCSGFECCREVGFRQFNMAFLDLPAQRPRRPKEDFILHDLDVSPGEAKKLASSIVAAFAAKLKTEPLVCLADVLMEVEDARWADLHQATGLAMQHLLRNFEVTLENGFKWTPIRDRAEIQDIRCRHE
jgi:hypothetical protein